MQQCVLLWWHVVAQETALAVIVKNTESSDSSSDSGKKKGLEVAYNLTTEDFSVFEGIINDFTKETGIDVTIYNGGDDYESAMEKQECHQVTSRICGLHMDGVLSVIVNI